MSVTIIVAGNPDIFGQGLRLLLEGQEDFRVIAEASVGLEASQLVQVVQPSVLVVDFMMSDLSGLEVTRQIRRHMRKLNLRTQADLIRHALQRGILPIDP